MHVIMDRKQVMYLNFSSLKTLVVFDSDHASRTRTLAIFDLA